MEMFGRTATVDQPAAEPDSYWVRFPDNSGILSDDNFATKPSSSRRLFSSFTINTMVDNSVS